MATPRHRSLTPNSCLLAVLLVVRSSSGSALSFHYPPRPRLDSPLTRAAARSTSPTPSSSSSSSGSSGEDDETTTEPPPLHDDTTPTPTPTPAPAKKKSSASDDAATVLGFKTDFLAGLLAPKMAAAKGGRFEMSVDDVVFLGAPVHVRPDGAWRKRKKRRKESGKEEDGDKDRNRNEAVTFGEESVGSDTGFEEETAGEDGDADDEREEEEGEGEAAEEKVGQESEGEGQGEGPRTQKGEGTMNMFHVVFVLNPPELEYHFRTTEMFDYVVKRFSRALKYEQAKDGYVWKEAEKISRLKERAAQKGTSFGELWRQILDQSNLAYAISRIYSDISQSKIAHILLNNSLGLSLQIPIISKIEVLPSLTDPQVPGLPLTTANSFGDGETEGDTMLAKHFTLLFLEEVDTILKDIAAETTESSASLARFVKSVKPTQSFLQISTQCGIPLHEMQILARHLIHWRKARAIPPIRQRDTYIVSPNADMRRLPALTALYAKAFPTLPALPKMLSLLSAKPKPFATFIPTKDHRGAYLEILTWLIRYSLVTQLRNFAWIKIPRNIKAAVRREQGEKEVADEDDEDAFILEPIRASGIESAWLEMITRNQPPDVKALFERMLKYLNGQHAIEKISVREGISRKEVRRVFVALDSVLVYARHW